MDGNQLVQPRDVLLVINQLQQPPTAYAAPARRYLRVHLNDEFYWDTSDDGRISPLHAPLVINHLISRTPRRNPAR